MNEITVTNQNELDSIPLDYNGRIFIKFGTTSNPAVLKHAWDNASAELWDNASAELWDNASAELYDNASAELWDNASAVLYYNASAVLHGNASAVLYYNASAVLYDNASAVLHGNASAVLYDNASAELYGNASAELWDNASAVLYGNASAKLWGNAQAVDRTREHKIECNGNSRVVYMPKTVLEYLDFYGLAHDTELCTLYKAVRKIGEKYVADRDKRFEYVIGEEVRSHTFDGNVSEACGAGINIAHLNWCLKYGKNWENLAILEMRVKISDILVPENSDGKVRAPKAFVVREVPLEECGIYGKVLAKRRKAVDE